MKKKNPVAPAQPRLKPRTNEEDRLDTPDDSERQIDWHRRQGNLQKERIQRGTDAKRLKGGKKGTR